MTRNNADILLIAYHKKWLRCHFVGRIPHILLQIAALYARTQSVAPQCSYAFDFADDATAPMLESKSNECGIS